MTPNEAGPTGQGHTADASGTDRLKQTAQEAGQKAADRASDVADQVRETAGKQVDAAKQAAEDKATQAKDTTANEIVRTADALSAAAKEFDEDAIQRDILREAANGLTELAVSMRGKSVGAMVADMSDFSRRNPTAFMSAAALAGFALGRFARSSGDTNGDRATHIQPDRGTAPRPVEPASAKTPQASAAQPTGGMTNV